MTDKAREMLAAEYEKDNPHSEVAKKLRLQFSGQLRRADVIALRAINAALRTAPAIDLGQFRDLIGFACARAINLPETDPRRDYIRQCSDLLALIDGQPEGDFVCTGDEIRCFDGNGCECRMRGVHPAMLDAAQK